MKVLAFPHRAVTSYNPEQPRASRLGDVMPLASAWQSLSTDAHAVGYLPADSEVQCPRYAKSQANLATENGVRQHWLCFDIDRPGHAPWSSLDEAKAALYQAIDRVPPRLRDYAGGYTTRAGLRLVWYLAQPIEVRHADHVLRTMGELLHDQGIVVDPSCFQWTRLFRLPRVVREGTPLLSVVEEPTPLPGSIFRVLGVEPTEENYAPPAEEDMPTEPEEIPDWLYTKAAPSCPELARGEPLSPLHDPEDGGSVFRAIRSTLARACRAATILRPAQLISLGWRSIVASGREPEEFWRFVCWVCAQEEAEAEADLNPPTWPTSPPEHQPRPGDSWWDAVADRASPKRTKAKYQSQVVTQFRLGKPIKVRQVSGLFHAFETLCSLVEGTPLGEDPAQLLGAAKGSYASMSTRDCDVSEMWMRAKQTALSSWQAKVQQAQSASADLQSRDLLERWPLVLTTGSHYLVLDARGKPGHWTYLPVKSEQLVPLMRKLQRHLPVDVLAKTEGDKGGMISPAVALDRFGSFVDTVAYASGTAGARFADGGRTVLLPCHRRADIEPAYSDDVATWLRLLGGEQHERLLDWLRALPKTAAGPLAALYLEGPKGCGKTLLAKGCSALWSEGACDYNRIAGSEFNGEILGSPILFADEGVSPAYGKGIASPSIQFRSFVSNGSHVVRAMYTPPLAMRAYLRVIITANGPDAIPFSETLGKDGIDAIVERVFHINVQPEAAAYLRDEVGADVIREEWLEGGALAAHIAWLGTQDVATEGRYLVCGEVTEWHRRFVNAQGLKPELFLVLAEIAARAVQKTGMDGAVADAEALYVHKSVVLRMWGDVVQGPTPRHRHVSQTLRAVASDHSRIRSLMDKGDERWYYRIEWKDMEEADVLSAKTKGEVARLGE